MRTLLLWAVCCLVSVGTAQAQLAWQWAQSFPAIAVHDIATDASGDVFVTGSFSGPVSFASPAFTATLSPVGLSDIFLARFDALGNVKWARQVGGNEATASGTAIALDGSGNAYVAGKFSDDSLTVNTGSAPLVYSYVSGSLSNVRACVLKLSAATGLVEWSRASASFPGSRECAPTDVAANPNGCFVVGGFGTSAGFEDATITGIRGAAFVAAYAASGALRWVQATALATAEPGPFPVSAARAHGTGVATDAAGNCYVTGRYSLCDLQLGGRTLPLASTNQSFVARLNPTTGAAVWLRGNAGNSELASSASTGISAATGGCYVGGSFAGTVAFGGPHTLTAATTRGYLARYDAASGTSQWVRPLPDATGPVCVTSSLINVLAASSAQPTDALVSTVKIWSFWPWGTAQGSTSTTGGNSTCRGVAQVGATVYVAGAHSGTVAFGSHSMTAPTDASHSFLAQFGPAVRCAPWVAPALAAFPNPALHDLQLVLPAGTQRVTLLDYFGRVVRQLNAPYLAASLDVRKLKPGPYVLRCEGSAGSSSLAVQVGQ